MPASPPSKLFIIYAREDQPALLELKAHLRPLEKRGDLTVWYDGEVLPGENQREVIEKQTEKVDIVLLLISSSFFNFETLGNRELQIALDKHRKSEAVAVAVIFKPCAWDVHPEIKLLDVLPKNKKPISSWDNIDEGWLDVVRGVQEIVEIKKANYADSLAKEEVKRAVELYRNHKIEESYIILSK